MSPAKHSARSARSLFFSLPSFSSACHCICAGKALPLLAADEYGTSKPKIFVLLSYGLDKMSTRWAFTGTRRNALLLTTLVFAWCVPPPGARAFCRLDKATQRHCVTCA